MPDPRLNVTVLGFDFGTRRIGVAVGQTITATATPLNTLRYRNQRPDWTAIGELIADWRPAALILGLPYNMDDTEVDWAPRVHRFGRQLHGRYRLPVHPVDERLTSIEARRLLGPAVTRGVADDRVDALAAALIVETWLREQP